MEHGTRSTYNNYGCRCDACREANRVRNLKRRRAAGATPPPVARHGSTSMYSNGCRCEDCKAAQSAYMKEWRARTNHGETLWEKSLATYGLSRDDYDHLLEAQGGVCAICSKPCSRGRRLSVDHCHETGKVRGLLCSACNKALGTFGDNLDGLMRAVRYLTESE